MTQQPHVHGPDCNHDHDHHDHDHGHVHGPNCGHAHQEPVRNALKDVGRNDPCPCGSEKKFKVPRCLSTEDQNAGGPAPARSKVTCDQMWGGLARECVPSVDTDTD